MPQNSSTPAGAPVTLTFEAGTLHLAAPRDFDPGVELGLAGWRWDERFGCWTCFGMGYRPFREAARVHRLRVEDHVHRWQDVELPAGEAVTLRDYQEEAIGAWEGAGRRGLVVLPTGMGKTEMALSIMRQVGASALVVSPVRDLMHQWHRRIEQSLNYDAGIIGDRDHEVRPISVTTYQSACIYADKLGADFKLLIFDECHHLSGRMKTDAARLSVAPYRLGLTATPRLGNEATASFEALIGPVCYQRPLSAVRGKHVADYGTTHISVELTPEERERYEEHGQTIRDYQARRRKEKPGWEWPSIYADAVTDPEARRALHAWRSRKRLAAKRSRVKAMAEGPRKELTRQLEKAKAQLRAYVEHPFHVVKNLFRHRKVRYRGLAKNRAQLHTLFALANLVLAKASLLAKTGA